MPKRTDDYDDLKARASERNLRLSRIGRDIAPLPAVVNPERKEKSATDFQLFCESYFPQTFNLPWSPDHLKILLRVQQAVLQGGLFAVATPRGSGKTSICERACIWATLCGHRGYVLLIGSTEKRAQQMLRTIRAEFDSNDLLLEDFPEAVYPIRRLEGIPNRCGGQLLDGQRTQIEWTARSLIMPTVPDSKASGAILDVAGLTGHIRGMKHQKADGTSARPDLVILDDPQTRKSARSASQCETREQILAGDVLLLAGPKKKISGIMPCTVIQLGDMADRILDRQKHPQWQGERMKMLYAFPTNTKLWEEYGEVMSDSLRAGRDGAEATVFYEQHRAEMDEGALVGWPECYDPQELSGIQHAMNLKLRDEPSFWAECQNEPRPAEEDSNMAPKLTLEIVLGRLNNRPRRSVAMACEKLTAFIDIQERLLYYLVASWRPDFTGFVLDYGTYPEQPTGTFTGRDAPLTLKMLHKGSGLEGAIYAGLKALTEALLSREWPREDGVIYRIDKCLIDAGWKADVVYDFCRQSSQGALLMPSHGAGIAASQKPISEYDRKRGDTIGEAWWIPSATKKRALRHLRIDTNWWKSFLYERLTTAIGDKGALTIFGTKPEGHRMFAEHLCAEYRVRTAGQGRTLDEWKLPPHQPDNHWFDCLVGAAACASMLGCRLGEAPTKRSKRIDMRGVPLAERWRMARERDAAGG